VIIDSEMKVQVSTAQDVLKHLLNIILEHILNLLNRMNDDKRVGYAQRAQTSCSSTTLEHTC